MGKTRTSERIVEMSEIARLTKSNCFSRTDACMKASRASNKLLKNARECFAPPSHLRLESERHKFNFILIAHLIDLEIGIAMFTIKKML